MGMKGAFLVEGGEERSVGVWNKCLDLDSTMLYTESMDETSCKSNRNVFYGCHYHVVWYPKDRRKVLVPLLMSGSNRLFVRSVKSTRQRSKNSK